ncbi:hypothetical protein EH183_38340 [Streptomyces sp. CB01881]|nr:hypothetical protein C2142_38340 [Streptomyces sp. CB01881]TYC68725.1 hypothetical protein EH183_38340 [Streptomyces sp. CB01881]
MGRVSRAASPRGRKCRCRPRAAQARSRTFRAVATRFDKRGYVHLGTVTTAALVIRLRTLPPVRHEG